MIERIDRSRSPECATQRRPELLAALLTIWRYGRFASDIKQGKPLGSYEQWCSWVRDPLLALGCSDPVERVSEAKRRDPSRQAIVALFDIWWARHRNLPVTAHNLHDDVKHAADPQGHGRQHLAAYLERLAGTRLAGYVLSRQAPAGKWGAATYALQKTIFDASKSNTPESTNSGEQNDAETASFNSGVPYDPYDPYGVASRSPEKIERKRAASRRATISSTKIFLPAQRRQ